MLYFPVAYNCLSMELIRLGGPAHGIVTKTVHKTLPGGGGVQGWLGVVGVQGGWVGGGGGPGGGWVGQWWGQAVGGRGG